MKQYFQLLLLLIVRVYFLFTNQQESLEEVRVTSASTCFIRAFKSIFSRCLSFDFDRSILWFWFFVCFFFFSYSFGRCWLPLFSSHRTLSRLIQEFNGTFWISASQDEIDWRAERNETIYSVNVKWIPCNLYECRLECRHCLSEWITLLCLCSRFYVIAHTVRC